MQFQFVTTANEHLFQPELEQFFRARHVVYAEELGWVPRSPDGLEYDAYDTAAAAYLIVTEGEDVVAGSRLVPTHLPHLLSEVFPDSCNLIPMPRDPLVVEWTRGFIVPAHRSTAGQRVMVQSCAAVMEYCLTNGYRQVGGIQDVRWLATWRRMGWSVHEHGAPIDIDGEDWLPAYFDVTEAAMLAARRWGRLPGPVLDLADLKEKAA